MTAAKGPSAQFERHRERLRTLAGRMLGDAGDAEDVVQEAWLRLQRNRPDDLRSLGAWLTTVVTRLCLDELRARARRDAGPGDRDEAALPATDLHAGGPERRLILADAVGVAMLVVLERLTPAERVAFVLHDVFDLAFDEIAPLIERSQDAARQLASRARRKVRGPQAIGNGDRARNAELARSFLAAAQSGDIAAMLRLLAPEAVLRPDATAARLGPGGDVRGAGEIAAFFAARGAGAAHLALIDGEIGLMVAPAGRLLLVLRPRFEGGRIASFDAIADPDALAALVLGVPRPEHVA
jgi:RNA polymerase sigma-70 factor, ECF subfamily